MSGEYRKFAQRDTVLYDLTSRNSASPGSINAPLTIFNLATNRKRHPYESITVSLGISTAARISSGESAVWLAIARRIFTFGTREANRSDWTCNPDATVATITFGRNAHSASTGRRADVAGSVMARHSGLRAAIDHRRFTSGVADVRPHYQVASLSFSGRACPNISNPGRQQSACAPCCRRYGTGEAPGQRRPGSVCNNMQSRSGRLVRCHDLFVTVYGSRRLAATAQDRYLSAYTTRVNELTEQARSEAAASRLFAQIKSPDRIYLT
jgi:hypothetical protein